jgi:hypothetical protein
MLEPYLTCRNFAELVPKQVNHIAKNFGIHGTFGVKEPLDAMELKNDCLYLFMCWSSLAMYSQLSFTACRVQPW